MQQIEIAFEGKSIKDQKEEFMRKHAPVTQFYAFKDDFTHFIILFFDHGNFANIVSKK